MILGDGIDNCEKIETRFAKRKQAEMSGLIAVDLEEHLYSRSLAKDDPYGCSKLSIFF